MIKKIFLLIAAATLVILSAKAQTERGTVTISSNFWGSSSGFFINIVPETEKQNASTQVNLAGKGAFYILPNLALTAGLYIDGSKYGKSDPVTTVAASAGIKYHFVRGFYGELSYYNSKTGEKDGISYGRVELGYDIFLNKHFYIEPFGYYRAGLNSSSSKLGIGASFGVAF
jgi:hypothetical protein